jgi:hypothetical protein
VQHTHKKIIPHHSFIMLTTLLVLASLICVAYSQAVSERQKIQRYLHDNGCKDRLLNIFILNVFNKRRGNLNTINEIVSTHMRNRFKYKKISSCYKVVVDYNNRYLHSYSPNFITFTDQIFET